MSSPIHNLQSEIRNQNSGHIFCKCLAIVIIVLFSREIQQEPGKGH